MLSRQVDSVGQMTFVDERIDMSNITTRREVLDLLRSLYDGSTFISAKKFASLGIKWPPRKGWVQRLIKEAEDRREKKSRFFRFSETLRPCANATCTSKIAGPAFTGRDYCDDCDPTCLAR